MQHPWGRYYRREIVPEGEGGAGVTWPSAWDHGGHAVSLPAGSSHHLVHRNWASAGLALGQHWPLGFHKTREALVTAESSRGLARVLWWPQLTHQNATRQLSIPGLHPELDHRKCWWGKPCCCRAPQETSSPWTPKGPRRDQPVRFSSKKLVSCDTSERKRQFRRRMFSLANTRVKIPPRIPAANELIADERRYSRCPSGRQRHPPAAPPPQGQRTGHCRDGIWV